MNHPIRTIEKILNTLGNKVIKDKYGLDLQFEVDKINTHRVLGNDNHTIRVNVSGDKVPYIIKDLSYDDRMWDSERYGVPSSLEHMLTDVVRYLDPNYFVIFNNVKSPYNHECRDYVMLKSVGTEICKESGMTEDKYMGGIPDIDNDEWWDALSDEDKEIIKSLFG